MALAPTPVPKVEKVKEEKVKPVAKAEPKDQAKREAERRTRVGGGTRAQNALSQVGQNGTLG